MHGFLLRHHNLGSCTRHERLRELNQSEECGGVAVVFLAGNRYQESLAESPMSETRLRQKEAEQS